MAKRGWFSEEVYRTVLENVPVPTADFILIRKCSDGKYEFLLSKRNENPYRGTWFVPGGRIFKGEKLLEAVKRNARRELGISAGEINFIGCSDVLNPPKLGIRWHSIWHLHTIEVGPDIRFRLNHENAKVKWFTDINPRWPMPVQKALAMAGFNEKNATS